MKFFLSVVAVFVIFSNTAFAEKPYNEAPVSVKMDSYISRELILFLLKNNSRTAQTITFTPGVFMNIPGAQSMRISIAPGEEKTQSFKLGSIDGVKLPLIIDYKVHYVKDRSSRIEIHNPMQFFVKDRAGEFRQTDARSMQAFQGPALERDERAEPTTLDLGAGAKIDSTLENLAFTAYVGTPEEEQSPVEEVRAELPRVLSERLRINSLPGQLTIPTEPPVVNPRNKQVNSLEQAFMDKGTSCDPLGLFNCYHGQLKVLNLKRSGNPASWGWTVELWATKVIFGAKVSYRIGNTETDGSGYWVIKVATKDAPVSAKVIFKPLNRFVNIVNPSTLKTYQYQDVIFKETHRVSLFNGTSQGGIARIFNYANQLWVRLSNGKVNPISGFGPYTIAFPNALSINGNQSPCTTKDGNGSLIAWSCAIGSPTGGIYLIPEHDDIETVVHELGHKIHKAHWGKFPAGSGGSHSMWKCYTKGLAIVEGFADFLASWIQSKSYDDVAGNFSGVNVETFRNGACFTAQNELAVVGMFWDLYDTQKELIGGEGMSDIITYYSDTNPIADFLGNGKVLSGAPEYMQYLKAKHTEVPEPLAFYGLFNLNVVAF